MRCGAWAGLISPKPYGFGFAYISPPLLPCLKQLAVVYINFPSVENNRSLCYHNGDESAFVKARMGGNFMDVMTIGKNIAEFRKSKGAKQDELAKFVGVTAQAVSKWENGGVPDTELLPKIAEFFNVSIDELFGRQNNISIDIQDVILTDISKTKDEDRISRAFELCWMIEQSMYGTIFSDPERFKEEAKTHSENDQLYSQMEFDSGYTEMGLFNRMQYFLVVPDAKDKDKALLDGIDYPEFFKLMADKDVFATLVFLYKRESFNAFTETLIIKELGCTKDKAKHVIAALLRLKILAKTVAELGDEVVEVYQFARRPSFVSMLIFAREMIDIPNNFYVNLRSRGRPYLK